MPSSFSLAFAIGLALAACNSAMAQDKPMPPDEAQIRSWIAALANRGSPRRFKHPGDRLTQQDREDLKPVCVAYENLTKHFLAALPYLIESRNDKRFSYPQEHPTSSVFENQSVGDACRNIIERKVLLRSPSVLDSRDIPVGHNLPIDKEWYARVKGMTLFEMQVDALDWILKQPPPDRVSPAQWNRELMEVQQFREKFVKKRLPEDRVFSPPIEGK